LLAQPVTSSDILRAKALVGCTVVVVIVGIVVLGECLIQVGEPPSVRPGPKLLSGVALATLLASLESSTGRPYQVYRVYCYNIGGNSPASYTNSLILNEKIYVPFFGNSTYDNEAWAMFAQTKNRAYITIGTRTLVELRFLSLHLLLRPLSKQDH